MLKLGHTNLNKLSYSNLISCNNLTSLHKLVMKQNQLFTRCSSPQYGGTYTVPRSISYRCTFIYNQLLHQVTPPWPRTTTRAAGRSLLTSGRIVLRISRQGIVVPCVGSRVASSVSHVKGQWRRASEQGFSRHQYSTSNRYVDREVASSHI